MESRNVTLTLEKAKEFYNSGNTALKEVALQAFTKDEILSRKFSDIKNFEDACYELAMHPYTVINQDIRAIEESGIEDSMKRHLIAIYKLDIIRKALNKGWNPKMTEGSVYYPYVRFYPTGQKAEEVATCYNWKLGESFTADDKKYTIVGGDCANYYFDGLSANHYGSGEVLPNLGLLGCKSKEIAEHMSRYFSKEIFEATYAHHIGTYQWI